MRRVWKRGTAADISSARGEKQRSRHTSRSVSARQLCWPNSAPSQWATSHNEVAPSCFRVLCRTVRWDREFTVTRVLLSRTSAHNVPRFLLWNWVLSAAFDHSINHWFVLLPDQSRTGQTFTNSSTSCLVTLNIISQQYISPNPFLSGSLAFLVNLIATKPT